MRIIIRRLLSRFIMASILLVGCSTFPEVSQIGAQRVKVSGENLSIILLGDMSFGENYQDKIESRGGENILKTKGYEHSLKNFAPFLRQANLVIANLETPLTDLPSSPLTGKKSYLHWSDLSKSPKTLKAHNISVLSLANNHTLDYGIIGLRQSLLALKKHDIRWFGAGKDEASAVQPLRFDYPLKGHLLRFMIAAGFEYRENYAKEYDFYAHGSKGGTNSWTVDRASEQMRVIRCTNPDAFLVAYPHFGKNYAWKTEEQTILAHTLINSGANLVVGHGAHLLQEIEQYQGGWIIYNLGNFVFNSPGRYQKKKMDPFSLIARIDVSEKKDELTFSLRLYPIFSNNLITDFQPYFVTNHQFQKIQKLLLHSSTGKYLREKMGTGKDQFGRYLVFNITPIRNIEVDNDGTQSKNKRPTFCSK